MTLSRLSVPHVLGLALAWVFLQTLGAIAAEFTFGELTLTVPDGFTIDQVAAPPLVDRPIMVDHDLAGYLYVADSSGSNDEVQTQLKEKPHRILRLEDADGDGVYDRRTVFADQMMFPEGVLWHDGALYVSAPPVIWKLTDDDADGVADTREVWHDGKTLTGCANDLHGPYLGPDGWIYWCKGAFAEQSYLRRNGSTFVSRAAHIFRKHPEGDLVEPVMTGGMDNPVEVVFSPEGERFFTTTFFQHPGGGFRDGIIHAVYGGVYGKNHNVLDVHPRTGGLMPVMTHHGPAASCALERYDAEAFGPEFEGNLFATLFNMRKVTRHVLSPTGATFQTADTDFLTGDHIDFHPTDVMQDHDGSLLVVDTGGWYKLCCPTSQLPKPQVLGAIYRVRKSGAAPANDVLGRDIQWGSESPKRLLDLLGDSRPAVQERALAEWSRRPPSSEEAITLFSQCIEPKKRQRLIWAATRSKTPSIQSLLEKALGDSVADVRHTALHACSVLYLTEMASSVAPLLEDVQPAVRRAAAEALGRLGEGSHVSPLLAALVANQKQEDRVLDHSLRYALIEIGAEAELSQALSSDGNSSRPFALAALQALKSPLLEAEFVVSLTSPDNTPLSHAAWKVIAEHPNWSPTAVQALPSDLTNLSAAGQRALTSLASTPAMQSYLGRQLKQPQSRSLALRLISQAKPEAVPASWLPTLEASLVNDSDPASRGLIIRILRSASPSQIDELTKLPPLALDASIPIEQRLSLLALLAKGSHFPADEAFPVVMDQMASSRPPLQRQAALDVLERMKLTPPQVQALVSRADQVGPLELPRFLAVLVKSIDTGSPEVSQSLFAALARNPSRESLGPEQLQALVAAAPEAAAVQVSAFRESLADTTAQKAQDSERLDRLLESLPEGDIVRGQTVFNSAEAACATCHAMGYRGGDLGPDLTRIGQIRSKRDLLESVILPSASLVRSYETVLITTDDGQTHLGIQKGESPHQLTLRTGLESSITLDRDRIREMSPAALSLMPPGLDTVVSQQQLADLLTFLENAKW